ncbi:MAG TPA: D-xylose ABC transporter ATP-binding protein [Firmicutes bacterium]|jgi:ABC-type sugar transport system ATPase subunit|nr:D-xylose ABC transporter ATP-binding protein [Bacillota bacterium]
MPKKQKTGNDRRPNKEFLELVEISKSFPGVQALDRVSISVRQGEVHGLVGQNGAGKSTLLKILTGAYRQDSGKIIINGEEIRIKTPADAQKWMYMIYQERTLVPDLTVAENMFIGNWSLPGGEKRKNAKIVDWKTLNTEAEKVIKKLGFDFDVKRLVRDLGAHEQQLVEIARALAIGGEIIIMDEPTAALPRKDIENLFEIIRQLKKNGVTVIYVSHHLQEIFDITDRITVLKDGKKVGTFETSSIDEDQVIKLMVGKDLGQERKLTANVEQKNILLEVKDLTTKDNILKNISFSLAKNEVLGIAGLIGSGKEAVGRTLAGLKKIESGEIILEGKKILPKSPAYSINQGIGFLPSDRNLEGLVLGMSLRENVTLNILKKISKYLVINAPKEQSLVNGAVKDVNLVYSSIEQQADSLSGGNRQRLLIARNLCADSSILIFNEPTQGVDVGAREEIYDLIRNYAAFGKGVIIASSDLSELLKICNRIMVMSAGEITTTFNNDTLTEDRLLQELA